MRSVLVASVPHTQQRYDTCGDWIYDPRNESIEVTVLTLPDWRESFCVAIHEQVEAAQCVWSGVREEIVAHFDILYERKRNGDEVAKQALKDEFGCTCCIDEDSEPGDDRHAPYYEQHQVATNVERIVATALGVHWPTYDDHVMSLDYPEKEPA